MNLLLELYAVCADWTSLRNIQKITTDLYTFSDSDWDSKIKVCEKKWKKIAEIGYFNFEK